MEGILFFFLAILTVFFSMKLSYYADAIAKSTKISKALIGGIILAGVTSLPELMTCLSAVIIDNPYLAIGDILGSNIFNIFIICLFDIIFLKKMFFINTSKRHNLVYLLLFINYIFIFIFFQGFNISILNIGLPSIVIFLTYFYYLYKLPKTDESQEEKVKINYLFLKFILTIIAILVVGILLTLTVNKIAHSNPSFSSSLIGAILLGVTTSLPEVITFCSLLKLNSYDLALADIIGSNLFNLLVLAISDVIFNKNTIYYYSDKESLLITSISIIIILINSYQNICKKPLNKLTYIIPSIIVVAIYLVFWYINI